MACYFQRLGQVITGGYVTLKFALSVVWESANITVSFGIDLIVEFKLENFIVYISIL